MYIFVGLFGIRDVMISTDHITEDHIEASRVYIQTLSKSRKHRGQTVAIMPGVGGDSCLTRQLQAVIDRQWLNGAVRICFLDFPI